jgi:transcriptional regulator with XRE-family HTH domain
MPPKRKKSPRSPEHAALGEAVRSLREKAGLTQEALADRAGKDFPRLGGLERGQTNPTFSTLLNVSTALQVSPSQLLRRYEEVLKAQHKGGE